MTLTPSPLAERPRGRDPFVDALRGLCLLVMTVNHFGGPLHAVMSQPLGYVSAAEGFIFLSGLATAGALSAKRERPDSAWRRPWIRVRVWRIYRAHIATVAMVAALLPLAVRWAPEGARAWAGPWMPLIEAPVRSVVGAATFVYLPAPFDVLPLYVAFLALAPVLVDAFDKGRARQVAVASAALWLISQVTLGRVLHWAVRPVPGADAPDFDVFGWQALFVAGLLAGWASRRDVEWPLPRRARTVTWVLVAAFFVARHVWADGGWLAALTSRPTLGPIRALNFALLALITWRLWPGARTLLTVRPLVTAGRHSLLVFSLQAGLVVLTVPFRASAAARGWWTELAVSSALTILVLLAPWVLEWARPRPRGTAAEAPVPAPRTDAPPSF